MSALAARLRQRRDRYGIAERFTATRGFSLFALVLAILVHVPVMLAMFLPVTPPPPPEPVRRGASVAGEGGFTLVDIAPEAPPSPAPPQPPSPVAQAPAPPAAQPQQPQVEPEEPQPAVAAEPAPEVEAPVPAEVEPPDSATTPEPVPEPQPVPPAIERERLQVEPEALDLEQPQPDPIVQVEPDLQAEPELQPEPQDQPQPQAAPLPEAPAPVEFQIEEWVPPQPEAEVAETVSQVSLPELQPEPEPEPTVAPVPEAAEAPAPVPVPALERTPLETPVEPLPLPSPDIAPADMPELAIEAEPEPATDATPAEPDVEPETERPEDAPVAEAPIADAPPADAPAATPVPATEPDAPAVDPDASTQEAAEADAQDTAPTDAGAADVPAEAPPLDFGPPADRGDTPRADDWSDDWGAPDETANPPLAGSDLPRLYQRDGGLNVDEGLAEGIDDARALEGAETEFKIANLDKAGTFRRPLPREYEPTRWDDYWVPEQNLLEEWVARGIKSVSIPIPGTRYKLVCTISVLQFGGGCGLDRGGQARDPKPPPDVPISDLRLPDAPADPSAAPPDPAICTALRRSMDAARTASELEAARDAAIQRGCTS